MTADLPWIPHKRALVLSLITIVLVGAVGFVSGWALRGDDRELAASAAASIPVWTEIEQRAGSGESFNATLSDGSIAVAGATLPSEAKRIVITASPTSVGETVREGSVVIAISNRPVIAMRSELPLFRDLHAGDAGADVAELNRGLERLKLRQPGGDAYDEATTSAVAALYRGAGYEAPEGGATLPMAELVRLPFESGIVTAAAAAGTEWSEGAVVWSAASERRAATFRADVTTADSLAVGDPVLISLVGNAEELSGAITAVGAFSGAGAESGSGDGADAGEEVIPPGQDVTVEFEVPSGTEIAEGVGINVTLEPSDELLLAVPLTALRSEGAENYVLAAEEASDKTRREKVRVLGRSGGWVLIEALDENALHVGDQVRVTP